MCPTLSREKYLCAELPGSALGCDPELRADGDAAAAAWEVLPGANYIKLFTAVLCKCL
jgi:hypothetical protein